MAGQNLDISFLREEILESEKVRTDLMKYKLFAVAVLGAVGAGIGQFSIVDAKSYFEPKFVLLLLPFLCVYIDLLCWHNSLRILVIGNFLHAHGDRYESYVAEIDEKSVQARYGYATSGRGRRRKMSSTILSNKVFPLLCRHEGKSGYFFHLEDLALHYSTVFVSTILILFGIVLLAKQSTFVGILNADRPQLSAEHGYVFVLAGAVGIGLALGIHCRYWHICDTLGRVSARPDKEEKTVS